MERPEVGPKGETRGIERVKSREFSRMGSGFAGESHARFYSCLFAKCVVEMCSEVGSAWDECRAEEGLGVPGKGNPGKSQTAATRDDPKKDLSDAVKKPIGDL
jgi:hypothetical protein